MRHIPKWNLYTIYLCGMQSLRRVYFFRINLCHLFSFSWETNLFKGSEINKKIITKGRRGKKFV